MSAPRPALWAALLALAAGPVLASDSDVLDVIFADWGRSQGDLGTFPIIRSFAIDETIEKPGTTRPAMDLHLVRTFRGHFRFEVSRPGLGDLTQAYDGRIGWQSQPQWGLGLATRMAADPWVVQNDLLLAESSFRAPVDYSLLADEDVNGTRCIVAALVDAENLEGKCYFGRGNHRLLALERQMEPGSRLRLRVEFDDFRETSGLWIPYLVKATVGTSVTVHRRSRVVLNPLVDESSFVLSTAQLREAVEVGDILNRHEATLGDPVAINRIQSRVTHLSLEVSTTGTTSQQTISQKGRMIVVDTDTPGMGRESRGFDGKTGWMCSELQGYRPLKPPELSQLLSEGSVHMVGRLAETYPFRRRLGERIVNGRPADALALATQQGPAGTFYFDKEDSRLVRIALPGAGDRTNSTEFTIDFSDFRRIDGMDIPFRLVETNAMVRAVSTVVSVENNVPLDDAIFGPRRE